MVTPAKLLVVTLLATIPLLTGCASKKQVLGNLYEGVQMQNRQAAPPTQNGIPVTPGYDEYLRQRGEVIKEERP